MLQKYILAYDADCGPCSRFREIADFLDPREGIDSVSLIDADRLGLLDKIPRFVRHNSFHLIFPNGEVLSGAKAIPALTEFFPLGTLLSRGLRSAPGGQRFIDFAYSALSRLHDSGSCRYAT